MGIDNWAFFDGNGNELTRGWQGFEFQARAKAQLWANESGLVVEFQRESELSHDADQDLADWEPPQGEVVEPE